jgi:hypothetical protein
LWSAISFLFLWVPPLLPSIISKSRIWSIIFPNSFGPRALIRSATSSPFWARIWIWKGRGAHGTSILLIFQKKYEAHRMKIQSTDLFDYHLVRFRGSVVFNKRSIISRDLRRSLW